MAGELYVDGCSLKPEQLLALGTLAWRSPRGESREVTLTRVRATSSRLLVTIDGVTTRELATAFVNGTLELEPDRLPDPGQGVSYAYELVGMRVVDPAGLELGRVADVIFNAGQPLLQLEGPQGKLLPCQRPFMKNVDMSARVITLDLPAGFDEF